MQDFIIVEVDNKGQVPGKTYQFYCEFTNENDHVHIVFGDEYNDMYIKSTEPFYQNEFGGAMSTNINAKLAGLDKTLKYDSYVTIGRDNSEDNYLSNFNLDLEGFEKQGGNIITADGAWYVTPDHNQAYCKDGNLHVMVMQLTTEGVITGKINLQGKDAEQILWREVDLMFTTENAISEKKFKKLKKAKKKEKK